MDGVVRIASWNIGRRADAWQNLLDLGVDVGLLQEARRPPPELEERIEGDPAPWYTAGYSRNRAWRAAVAGFSDHVRILLWPLASIAEARPGGLAVSRPGTLAVADITIPSTGEVATAASVYGA